jgi:hypothetical protein
MNFTGEAAKGGGSILSWEVGIDSRVVRKPEVINKLAPGFPK